MCGGGGGSEQVESGCVPSNETLSLEMVQYCFLFPRYRLAIFKPCASADNASCTVVFFKQFALAEMYS